MTQRMDIIGRFLLAAMMWVAGYGTAHAQSSYVNTNNGDIDSGTECGTNNLTRTFNVTDTFVIDDVNLGVLADHTWRGDIRLDLRSPANTTRRLVNSDTSGSGNINNYNIELDDSAGNVINTPPHDTDDNTGAAPYQNSVRPNNQDLAGFNGETANGTWTLIMCDDEPDFDDGEFLQATLTLTPVPGADVSVDVTASDNSPEFGSQVTITVELANAGPNDTTNLSTQINLPAGLSYDSHSGLGNYNPGTGVWTRSPLNDGDSVFLNIVATVEPTGPYNVIAELTASDQSDPDSTPNNGVTTEDDYDALTLTPTQSTTPPALACPIAQQFTHDWSAPGTANGWDSGNLTNSYVAGGEDLTFTFSGNTNRFIARNGTQTPVTTTQFGNPEHGIVMNVDFAATSEQVTMTMDLGDPGTGVGAAQFDILDVDQGAWIDRITVTGSRGGISETPILTPGTANSVSGNVVTGTGGSPTGDTAGDVTITFNTPVDQIVFVYDNASATANPSSQVISLQDITMCPLNQARITAAKTVEMSDPAQHTVPGAEILYKITVTNDATATAAADNIDLSDTLPDNVRFVSATPSGFTGGTFNSPALPAANTDCDSGACVIHFDGASLAIGATGEIEIRATVK